MTQRLQPGCPCQYVTRSGATWGAVIVKVYPPTEQTPEGIVDLLVYDPETLSPQPARLVEYLSAAQCRYDGTDARNTWHWIE